MAKDFSTMEDSNPTCNPSLDEVSDPGRRVVLRGGLGTVTAAIYQGFAMRGVGSLAAAGAASMTAGCAVAGSSGKTALGFKGIAANVRDEIVVPEGYTAQVLAPWGEPVGISSAMPAFKMDGSNTAEEQAVQMGMHHDGLHFYPLQGRTDRGLLVMNHEYTDDGLLHPDGVRTWTADKVRKAQAAHGVSVIEVQQQGAQWQMVRPSRYARRFTANTPFSVGGPAAGHPMMRTSTDPTGMQVLGTLNNCASGLTPWGTYLSGEENFAFYFTGPEKPNPHQARWGMRSKAFFDWGSHDPRFDATKEPNEFNRFGWVVEIDPFDPESVPVKRSALGRAAHEGAWVGVTKDQRAVVYSGEDARFEYIYKFVSRDPIQPGGAKANRHLLDHGTLYVARFDADGTGRWLPLVHGQGPLTADKGFADQGEVVIKARQASDVLGATKMDRPEWLAIDQQRREVFCTLTNNSDRGKAGRPGTDAANPRANNTMGQIIRWQERGDFDATQFAWSHLVLAGDPANDRAEAKGTIKGDIFGCPDGLAFDQRGVLWIQTDAHATQMYKGEFTRLGNNQMLACDLSTGEIRRFLTGPVNCEITGATWSPDGTTMFINVQHPGETPSDRSDPDNPTKYSRWPAGGRPRSATVVIRKVDGGVIGT